MATRKKYDAVATIGKYKDRDGKEKKRYLQVGTVFENTEDGRLSMKLDAVPVGGEWSGFISFYEPKAREQQQDDAPPARPESPAQPVPTPSEPDDDDIPF